MTAGTLAAPAAAYRCELTKLGAQVRTKLVVALALVAPFAVAGVLSAANSVPEDTLFGRWVHESGFAIPLVILGFAGQWALPAVTSIVAGDMFAAEDRYGTWPTILTRSRTRGEVFAGKVLVAMSFTLLIIVVLAFSSLAAGVFLVNHDPLVGLSGQLIQPRQCAFLVLLSWATVIPPALGFTALGLLLSVASRNGAVGVAGPIVIGLLMQLGSLANAFGGVQVLFLTTPFAAWHGLMTSPRFYGPLEQGAVVSTVYFVLCLGGAYLILRRRDMAVGG